MAMDINYDAMRRTAAEERRRWFDKEHLSKLLSPDNHQRFPSGFFTNFGDQELEHYAAAVAHINDPAVVLRHDYSYTPSKGVCETIPGRHSIWYQGKGYVGPYGHALTTTIDALRVKRYMPPHGVGHYQAELHPHIGSLLFHMDVKLWLEKYNFSSWGYGPRHIVFTYPVQWHAAMVRLAEVMNEPGDGSEVFVLVFYKNAWHVCRDQGRETVASFPLIYRGYMDLTEHGLRCALAAVNFLNRGNNYIPTPPRPVSFQQQLKEAFINFKQFALISGDLISARIAV